MKVLQAASSRQIPNGWREVWPGTHPLPLDFLPTDTHRDWAVTAHIKATEPNGKGAKPQKLQERGGAGGELWGQDYSLRGCQASSLLIQNIFWVWLLVSRKTCPVLILESSVHGNDVCRRKESVWKVHRPSNVELACENAGEWRQLCLSCLLQSRRWMEGGWKEGGRDSQGCGQVHVGSSHIQHHA